MICYDILAPVKRPRSERDWPFQQTVCFGIEPCHHTVAWLDLYRARVRPLVLGVADEAGTVL